MSQQFTAEEVVSCYRGGGDVTLRPEDVIVSRTKIDFTQGGRNPLDRVGNAVMKGRGTRAWGSPFVSWCVYVCVLRNNKSLGDMRRSEVVTTRSRSPLMLADCVATSL